MTKKEWYFLSSDNKTNIHAVEYVPEEGTEIKGVVQIAHGCSENARIYENLAIALADHGFIVRANDHIGHGLSVSEGQKRTYFGERGSWKYPLKDLHTLRCMPVPDSAKNRPYIFVGHSLGAFLVREYLIRYNDVDAAVISGSGTQPVLGIKFVQKILEIEIKKNGYDSNSDMVQNIMHGANNRKIKGAKHFLDWLIKDPEGKELFMTGDDIGGEITAGIFMELSNSMLFSQNKQNLQKMNKNIPLLFIAGKEDASVSFGKGIKSVVKLYGKCGIKNVTYKLYDNCRHCIFQDYSRDQVVSDVVRWIEKVIKR